MPTDTYWTDDAQFYIDGGNVWGINRASNTVFVGKSSGIALGGLVTTQAVKSFLRKRRIRAVKIIAD